MLNIRDKCAIAGIGCTAFSKKSGVNVRPALTKPARRPPPTPAWRSTRSTASSASISMNSVPSMSVATALGLTNPQYVVELPPPGAMPPT